MNIYPHIPRFNARVLPVLFFFMTILHPLLSNAGGYVLHIYQEPSKDRATTIPMRMLQGRLDMIMMKNGIEKGKSGDRFILAPVMKLISRDTVSVNPVEVKVKLSVILSVGDGLEGTRFATTTIQLEGKGSNEAKAYVEALRLLTPDNKEVTDMLSKGKAKIKEYYTKNCASVIKNAQELSEKEQYEMAILKLISIPDSCKDCAAKCMVAVEPVYPKYLNQQCVQRLASAKKIWTGGQTEENAKSALHQLSQIDPESVCYEDAKAYYDQITGYFKSQGKEIKDVTLKAPYKDDEAGKARLELYSKLKDKHRKAGGITTKYITTDW